MAQGVVDQVGQHFGKQQAVAGHHRRGWFETEIDFFPIAAGPPFSAFRAISSGFHRLGSLGTAPGIWFGQGGQGKRSIYQMGKPQGRLRSRSEPRRLPSLSLRVASDLGLHRAAIGVHNWWAAVRK